MLPVVSSRARLIIIMFLIIAKQIKYKNLVKARVLRMSLKKVAMLIGRVPEGQSTFVHLGSWSAKIVGYVANSIFQTHFHDITVP